MKKAVELICIGVLSVSCMGTLLAAVSYYHNASGILISDMAGSVNLEGSGQEEIGQVVTDHYQSDMPQTDSRGKIESNVVMVWRDKVTGKLESKQITLEEMDLLTAGVN